MCLAPTALQGCVRYTLPSLQTPWFLSLQQAGEITISKQGTPRLSSLARPLEHRRGGCTSPLPHSKPAEGQRRTQGSRSSCTANPATRRSPPKPFSPERLGTLSPVWLLSSLPPTRDEVVGGLHSPSFPGETKHKRLLREGTWLPCQDTPRTSTAWRLTIYCAMH